MTATLSTIPQKLKDIAFWQGDISVRPLTGGLSNESYIVSDQTGKYIARFCNDIPAHHVIRQHEAMVSRAAAHTGFAPELVYDAPGVMVFKFIEAKTYDKSDIVPNLQSLVTMIHRFHHIVGQETSGPGRIFWVFHVIRDYAHSLKADHSRFAEKLDGFTRIAAHLEDAQTPQPIVFTHNDLLPANFMDDGEKIWLIDFEYAAYGTAMFDLANLASNADFNDQQDEHLLQLYYKSPPNPQLLQSLAAMKCASLLREAMWSMISEIHLAAPGVDYGAYADECLPAFYAELEKYQLKYGKIQ